MQLPCASLFLVCWGWHTLVFTALIVGRNKGDVHREKVSKIDSLANESSCFDEIKSVDLLDMHSLQKYNKYIDQEQIQGPGGNGLPNQFPMANYSKQTSHMKNTVNFPPLSPALDQPLILLQLKSYWSPETVLKNLKTWCHYS